MNTDTLQLTWEKKKKHQCEINFLIHIPGHIVLDMRAHYSFCTLTGLACVTSWLFATQVKKMMVITELSTKEKNRFLCRVILWQLKLLSGRKQQTTLDWVEREACLYDMATRFVPHYLLKIEKYPQRSKQRYQRQSMTNQSQVVEIKCCLKRRKEKKRIDIQNLPYEQKQKLCEAKCVNF